MAEKKAATSRKPKDVPAKAAEGTAKPARVRKAAAPEVTPEEHWRMVAEAAYYIAEKRGFVGGDPAHDWCEAEQQVELFLQPARKPVKKKAGA